MAFYAGEVAVPAAATDLATLLSITQDSLMVAKYLSLQSITGAANPVFIGESDVTVAANRGRELAAAGALAEFHCNEDSINLNKVFVIGTVAAGNRLLITWIA